MSFAHKHMHMHLSLNELLSWGGSGRCGHCKNLAPHWASAATKLKGKVRLGALDATTETATAGRYQVSVVMTIKRETCCLVCVCA